MCKVLKHHGVLIRLSSQAGKAAWPFKAKSHAPGSRKRQFFSVGRRWDRCPGAFQVFFGFPISRKKILLLVAYRETMFGKTITFFYQKNNNLNDPDRMTTSLTYPAEETLLTDYECINASRRRRNVALKEDSIEFLDP